LDPNVCVSLTNHIHGNKFFNRKVYVTSVVEKTPAKESSETEVDAVECPNSLVESSGSGSDSSDDSEADEVATVEKPPCSKLFSKISEPVKRPAQDSPEITSESKKNDKKKKKENASLRSSSRHGNTKNKK
jgi:hypothetical protein